jgi:hypothetical protein
MANPVFTGYKFRDSDYRTNNGKITDITVSGGTAPYTITWSGPSGYSHTYNGSGPYNLGSLKPGQYSATVTDGDGDSSSISLTINELGRLFLSVDDNKTTNDCEGTFNITDFKHNGFDFKYTLTDSEGNIISTHTESTGNEAHQFSGLCNGGYKIIATETQRNEYVYDGSSTTTTVISSNSSYVYETYLVSKQVSAGSVDNGDVTLSSDKFEAYGSTTDSYIEYFTKENTPANEFYSIIDRIVKSPKPTTSDDVINCNTASLKISVVKKSVEEENTCDYVSFSLDANGLILFRHKDNSENYNMTQECCSALGYNPELDAVGKYVCRWKEVITDPCHNYSITDSTSSEGYRLFINNETGGTTTIVPSSECCSNENLSYTSNGEGFSCYEKTTTEPTPTCEDYIFSGNYESINERNYAIFSLNNTQTKEVPTPECCVSNNLEAESYGTQYRCMEPIEDCSTYTIEKLDKDGYVVFRKPDGLLVRDVEDAECCGTKYEAKIQENGMYKCQEPQPEEVLPRLELVSRNDADGECSLMTMNVYGKPNTTVKYRILVRQSGSHGFTNSLTYKDGGRITPAQPTPSVGAYCEGSITVNSSGVAVLEMVTCTKPPLREIRDMNESCSELEFSIYNYDYTTIAGENKLNNRACFNP